MLLLLWNDWHRLVYVDRLIVLLLLLLCVLILVLFCFVFYYGFCYGVVVKRSDGWGICNNSVVALCITCL